MRHGLHIAKLSRPTAHRVLMLRNLVSSLLQHEQITTTLPKAKAAQKLADKVIQWGKDGGKSNWVRANAFLLNPKETLEPLFTTFAARYAQRPGGYTRVQRAGYRVGDRAPLAVLELVDNRNDLRFENAARTVGRELAVRAREGAGMSGWWTFRERVEDEGPERIAERIASAAELDGLTRKNVVKALQFRALPVPVPVGDAASTPAAEPADEPTATTTKHPATVFLDRAYHHYLSTLASFSLASAPTPDPSRSVKQLTQRLAPRESKAPPAPVLTVPRTGRVPRAGERVDGWEQAQDVAVRKTGGPISRAKHDGRREARRDEQRAKRRPATTVDELQKELEERLEV
ncbi:hypothetical protein JCM1841_003258 [Sporobolomyces salmonicolor]